MKLPYQNVNTMSCGKQNLQKQKDPFLKNSGFANLNKDSKPWRVFAIGVFIFTVMSIFCISFALLELGGEQHVTVTGESQLVLEPKVISCYYNTPDLNNSLAHQLLPSQIHPHLCTHINVAFARVVHKEIYLENSQCETLQEIVKLKQANPSLKVLLSVGGAKEDNGFSEMVIDHASRKVFIKSIKNVLRNYSLDGVDLDWEFPALHLQENSLATRERQHFSQLLREIRMEYIREKRNYLLTVAIAAPQTIADVSYDVDQINLYVDFANIMTYDFHYYSKFTPFTGLNSPLYARDSERLYLATLNINYTVHMYTEKGLDKNKIVVGIPMYGHTFKLVNADNPNIGSPASSFGSLGGSGFVNYPDVCSFWETYKLPTQWDEGARVPYLHRGREWVSFDSPRSVEAKADYIRASELRGAMLYSLNADDYEGACSMRRGATRFPLAQAVRRVLGDGPRKLSARLQCK